MPGLASCLCIEIQLVFQRDRRILAGDKMIIFVINPRNGLGREKISV